MKFYVHNGNVKEILRTFGENLGIFFVHLGEYFGILRTFCNFLSEFYIHFGIFRYFSCNLETF